MKTRKTFHAYRTGVEAMTTEDKLIDLLEKDHKLVAYVRELARQHNDLEARVAKLERQQNE
jgi:hypothetical protein